jgi:hypothetical protein
MGTPEKKPAGAPGKTVEEYVSRLPDAQQRLVNALIDLVRKSAPESKLSIKWGQPVFEQNGPMIYVRAFKNHVNFGFWRGVAIDAGRGILQSGGDRMAHLKLVAESEINPALFRRWVTEAVSLNRKLGDPSKRR